MSLVLKELSVIEEVAAILQPLSTDEQRRVLLWMEDYFDVFGDAQEAGVGSLPTFEPAAHAALPETTTAASDQDDEALEEELAPEEEQAPEEEPQTFAALYERVAPKTAIQKIVVAAYWLETKEGQTEWKSFAANKLLKSLDIKLSSVSGTLAIEGKKETPLVKMMSKAGDSMQARKTYQLSSAGMSFIEGRLG